MEARYKILRIISLILKGIAILLIVATVFVEILILFNTLRNGGESQGVGALLGQATALPLFLAGAISCVLGYAAGEVVSLLVDLEENTRGTVFLLEKLLDRDAEEKG